MNTKESATNNVLATLTILAGLNQKDEGKLSRFINKATIVSTVGYSTYQLIKVGHNRYKTKDDYVITVPGYDSLYDIMLGWIYQNTPPATHGSILATLGDREIVSLGEPSKSRPIVLKYSGTKIQKFEWQGYTFSVELENLGNNENILRTKYRQLHFRCDSIVAREALLELFAKIEEENSKNPPSLFIPRWGSWNKMDSIIRPLKSVILDRNDKETVVNDLRDFLDSESKYTELGIPFHRGYLFHGRPGNGKSSLAQALAVYFGLDVYYLPLADMKGISSGENLLSLITNVPARSILLLEDLDILKSTHDRTLNEDDDGPSLATIMNILDGSLTPHGMISVATTNRIEDLDEALIRSGRFDVNLEISHLTDSQVKELFLMAYGPGNYDLSSVRSDVCAADIVNIFKTNLGNPEEATRIYENKFTTT